MSHDADRPQGMRVQLKVNFHGFSNGQFALNQCAKAAFANVETDAPCRLDSACRQVAQGHRNAAERTRVPSYGAIRTPGSLGLITAETHRNDSATSPYYDRPRIKSSSAAKSR